VYTATEKVIATMGSNARVNKDAIKNSRSGAKWGNKCRNDRKYVCVTLLLGSANRNQKWVAPMVAIPLAVGCQHESNRICVHMYNYIEYVPPTWKMPDSIW